MTCPENVDVPFRHLYVHVPFCARRCSYCDFSIAVRRAVPVAEYINALTTEMEVRQVGRRCDALHSLYLGGGTPSRLGADGVSALLHAIRRRVVLDVDAEVTLEANPEDITIDALRAWRVAGVNRLSIGVQSFDDAVLRWMHRAHNAKQARDALALARAQGFDAFSVDLIFGVPDALERNWERDIDEVATLRPHHVSLYGLTVETHTPLGRWRARGESVESPEERYEAEFLHAHHQLTDVGFEHYEVSNFALPGRRARHNSAYWNEAPYLGVGPSAHGFDGTQRRWNESAYAAWLRRVTSAVDPVDGCESLTGENRSAEAVYLGLRTRDGLTLHATEGTHVASWLAAGWVEWTDVARERIRCTATGWLRLDSLAADLTAFRSH